MTLDSTYLRARLARVIQEHLRLHKLDRLSLSIGLVEIIILHELARERGKHDRLQYFLAFCPDQENALGIMHLKDRVPGSIHSSSQCFLDDRQNRFRPELGSSILDKHPSRAPVLSANAIICTKAPLLRDLHLVSTAALSLYTTSSSSEQHLDA